MWTRKTVMLNESLFVLVRGIPRWRFSKKFQPSDFKLLHCVFIIRNNLLMSLNLV